MHSRTIAWAVRGAAPFSAASASASHCSRSIDTWCSASERTAFSMIRSTSSRLPFASSSFAAVIQI